MRDSNSINNLQRFNRDAHKSKTKIITFPFPKTSDPTKICYEAISQYPSIKIYPDSYDLQNENSSVDCKIASMLKTPEKDKRKQKNTKNELFSDYHHKRQKTY